MKPSRILVVVALQRYVNPPPVSIAQRDIAVLLAKSSGAVIDVLSVEGPVHQLPAAESVEEKLALFTAPLRAESPAIATTVRHGRPVDQILAHAKETGADLIVIGSHSKRGPMDTPLGNVAAALLRQAPVPVLLVRPTLADVQAAEALRIPNYPWIFPYV